jgi:7-cyano-7-deazaguanine synthase
MPNQPRKGGSVCVLASGGVDSAALIDHYLKSAKTVYPVYVQSGYFWEKAEVYWLRRLLSAMSRRQLKPLTILCSPTREFFPNAHWAFTGRGVPDSRSADEEVYLPGRNLLLLSAAAVFCDQKGISTLALGSLSGNPFRDASLEFFSKLGRAFASGLGRPFQIKAPFRGKTKKDVVRRAGALPWGLTFSCLSPSGLKSCGACNKCEERRRAIGDSAVARRA